MFNITFVRYESSKWSMHILCWTVPSIWQQTAERQSLPVTGFLRVIYAILNASVILERNEMRLARNEKRLERNETRLARNETRSGNLLLSGTVSLHPPSLCQQLVLGLCFHWVIETPFLTNQLAIFLGLFFEMYIKGVNIFQFWTVCSMFIVRLIQSRQYLVAQVKQDRFKLSKL